MPTPQRPGSDRPRRSRIQNDYTWQGGWAHPEPPRRSGERPPLTPEQQRALARRRRERRRRRRRALLAGHGGRYSGAVRHHHTAAAQERDPGQRDGGVRRHRQYAAGGPAALRRQRWRRVLPPGPDAELGHGGACAAERGKRLHLHGGAGKNRRPCRSSAGWILPGLPMRPSWAIR